MAEETMPATDAEVVATDDERAHYEFAFHVLPTVADGEVAGVFEALETLITNAGGEITTEEAPGSFELAYPIVKAIDGRNQEFQTSYFGWIRFRLAAESLAELSEEIDARSDILRSIMVKLTKEEEAHPFKVHEVKPHTTVVGEEEDGKAEVVETITKKEDDAEVKEEELEESLEKITT